MLRPAANPDPHQPLVHTINCCILIGFEQIFDFGQIFYGNSIIDHFLAWWRCSRTGSAASWLHPRYWDSLSFWYFHWLHSWIGPVGEGTAAAANLSNFSYQMTTCSLIDYYPKIDERSCWGSRPTDPGNQILGYPDIHWPALPQNHSICS